MQSRTKLLVGIATVTTLVLAFARRGGPSSNVETEEEESPVAEEKLELARP